MNDYDGDDTMAKKKRRNTRSAERISALILVLAFMAMSFAAGWYFGVRSTKYRGEVLLVNDKNRLSADYVPEGLVNLYQNRHSFRLASSEITLTRETYEAA